MQKNRFAHSIIWGIIFLSFIITGCAAKKTEQVEPQSGLVLKYQLPQGQTLTYKRSSDTDSNSEAMGQSIKTTIKSDADYTIKGSGVDDQNNLMLQITINDFNFALNTPQGNMSPDTSALKGKSFGAVHSPDGKQLEVTGVEDLPKIVLVAGAEQDVTNSFEDIFPILPVAVVKTGESWTRPIDRNIQQGQTKIALKGETTSVIEGFETIQGMECVKIKSQSKSGIEGSGTQMGQAINYKGDLTSTSVWYFAYKKGILVKSTSEANENVKINMGAMEIPQTAKTKVEIDLVI